MGTVRFADVCAQLWQSTLLKQEVTETRRRDSGTLVQCPPKMVAGQLAFESLRMCNKCMSLACFQPAGSNSSDWVGAVLWKASPEGSPDPHDGAMIFPLQPFFSGCTQTCPDPGTTGLSTFPLSQSGWDVVNKSFPSVPWIKLRTPLTWKKWVSNGGNSELERVRGRVWGVCEKPSN